MEHVSKYLNYIIEPIPQITQEAQEEEKVLHKKKRTVKHFALRRQAVALGHQIVNFLAALQNALNGLVQDNLGLVELFLNLHDTVGLLRVLVLRNVLIQFGHDERGRARGPRRARVLGEELVDDFAEDLMGDEGRVLVVRDDDAADALCAAVGVKRVVYVEKRQKGISVFIQSGQTAGGFDY